MPEHRESHTAEEETDWRRLERVVRVFADWVQWPNPEQGKLDRYIDLIAELAIETVLGRDGYEDIEARIRDLRKT